MGTKRCLSDVLNRYRVVDSELHPQEVNRHHEAALICFGVDRDDSLEDVKDVRERGMDAGIVAERSDGSMQSWKPSINPHRSAPAIAGAGCCRALRRLARIVGKCGRVCAGGGICGSWRRCGCQIRSDLRKAGCAK